MSSCSRVMDILIAACFIMSRQTEIPRRALGAEVRPILTLDC